MIAIGRVTKAIQSLLQTRVEPEGLIEWIQFWDFIADLAKLEA